MGVMGIGIWSTNLGKALQKIVPPRTRRIVIDIPCNDVVTVNYVCVADKDLLDLPWDDLLARFAVRELKPETPASAARQRRERG